MQRPIITHVCALLTLTGAAFAQSDQRSDDPLRGPRVRQQRAPGTEQPFAAGDRRQAGTDLQMRALLTGVRSLGSDEAPESVRLTPEQSEKIRRIFSDLRRDAQPGAAGRRGGPQDGVGRTAPRDGRSQRDDRPQRSARPDAQPEARPDARPNDRAPRPQRETRPERTDRSTGDARPPRSDMPEAAGRRGAQPPQDRAAQRERMAGVSTEIWSILTPEQREYVRARMQDGRDDAVMLDAPRGREGAPRDGASRRAAPGWVNEMPPSLKERLDSMSPEERQALWTRLDRALNERPDRSSGEGAPRPRRR